jgi:hypothetical protein
MKALRGLMEFYEAAQSQNEEEAEVDLMVQLSGLVHHDWRMEEPESLGRLPVHIAAAATGGRPQAGQPQPRPLTRSLDRGKKT